jgi:thiazole/oxazole-forming peptide maturase SagD family component
MRMGQLAEIAAAFRADLPGAWLHEFRIDGLDRIGLPVTQAALLPEAGHSVIGYGYGASEAEAVVGALGELCEEVQVGAWIAAAPRIRASRHALRRERGDRAVADPCLLCLPAGSPWSEDDKIDWVEARRWGSDEPVLVPVEWIAAYPDQLADEGPWLIPPITNGLGAGLDLAHAVAHGVMELLQRDGNVLQYRALDRGTVVELDGDAPAAARALVGRLSALGIAVTVKLAATDFGMANLYVVGDDSGPVAAPIQVTACGEACHPDRDRALLKALHEFVGSRARKAATHGPIEAARRVMPEAYVGRQLAHAEREQEEPRALAAMAEWTAIGTAELRRRLADTVFTGRGRVAFSDLPTVAAESVGPADRRLALLASRLAEAGMDILYVDCSPPGSAARVVKVIVPGLECETMSYHRIGWRGVARLRERDDPLLRDAPTEGSRRVRLRAEDEAQVGGPAWFDAALADRIVDTLYPLYREPGPFSAQLARRMAA